MGTSVEIYDFNSHTRARVLPPIYSHWCWKFLLLELKAQNRPKAVLCVSGIIIEMTNISIRTLQNGVRLIHERNKGSKVCSVWLRCRAGADQEEVFGAAHLLEHLVLTGTKEHPTKDALESLASELGGRGGGRTSYDDAQYWSTVPLDALPQALAYVFEVVHAPLLRKEDFLRERKIVYQEAKRRDSQSMEHARQLIRSTLYPNTAYGRTIIGTTDDIQAISHEAVTTHFQKHYTPQSTVLAVVADIDTESVVAAAEKVNRATQQNDFKVDHRPVQEVVSSNSSAALFEIEDSKAEQIRMIIAFPAFGHLHPGKPTADVAATILGGGKMSRLFKAIRQVEGLSYDASASINSGVRHGRLEITSGTTLELLPKLVETIRAELKRMVTDPYSEEECARARKRNIFSYDVQYEQAQNRSDSLSWTLMHADDPATFLDKEARYNSVSKDDVARVIRGILAEPPVIAVIKQPSVTLPVSLEDFLLT